MTAKTNNQTFAKVLLIVSVICIAAIFSCNNAADEKKAESAADTTKAMTDTSHAMMSTDSTKAAVDTGRETKVPH